MSTPDPTSAAARRARLIAMHRSLYVDEEDGPRRAAPPPEPDPVQAQEAMRARAVASLLRRPLR